MKEANKDAKVYFSLHLSGGATNTLAQLVKLATIEASTNMRARELFPAGVIADSAGALEAVALHDLSAIEVLKEFIKTSHTALPPKSFYVHQIVGRGAKPEAHIIRSHGVVRYSQSPLRENFGKVLGERRLEDVQWGLSIALHNPDVPTSDKTTFIHAVPIFGQSGLQETLKYSHQPSISLAEIVLAATAIPGVYEAVKIEGLEGQYIDATIDQDPTIYLHEVRVNNPNVNLGYVRLGNISPNHTYLSSAFRTASALKIRDNVRLHLLREQTHSTLLGRLARRWGSENVYDLDTFVDLGQKGAPDLNPIANTKEAREKIVKTVISDLLAREEEYKSLMRTLVRQHRLIHNGPVNEDIALKDFDAIIPHITEALKEAEGSLNPERKSIPPSSLPSQKVVEGQNKGYELGYAAGKLCRSFLSSISPKLADALNTGVGFVSASMNPLEDPLRRKSEP